MERKKVLTLCSASGVAGTVLGMLVMNLVVSEAAQLIIAFMILSCGLTFICSGLALIFTVLYERATKKLEVLTDR